MPYGLTAFQANTWLQRGEYFKYTLSPWLEITCNTAKDNQNHKRLLASSLPSDVLGGGMLHVPENGVPYRVSHSPVEIH